MATHELQSHIDRYVIRRVLGTGAMGSVYAAWDPKLQREIALKVVPSRLSEDPKGRERFQREARAIAAVRHPNIVEIYDYSGTDSPHLFLVIEKLDGQDLYAVLNAQGLMGEAVAVAIAHELCLALQVLHEAGIIHRDLKPENVFFNHNGRIVLTDFGIVKAVREGAAVAGYRDSTDVIGTPGFMAPELMRGHGLGPATDIFALGVLLYNITTKRLPFEGMTPMDIFKAAVAGNYADPRRYAPTLSAEFCDLLRACLKADPRQRPRSAESVRQMLKAIGEDLGSLEVRDDLLAYSKNSGAFAQFAQQRAVRRVLVQLKVAAKDHDAAQVERFRRRLQVLDSFNEEVADISGVMPLAAVPRRRHRWAMLSHFITQKIKTMAETGAYSLQKIHHQLPRQALGWAGLLLVLGCMVIAAYAQQQKNYLAQQARRAVPTLPSGAAVPALAKLAVPPLLAVHAATSSSTGVPHAKIDVEVEAGRGNLQVDGKALGRFQHRALLLSSGHHVIAVRSGGRTYRRVVNLAAGDSFRLQVYPRRQRVRMRSMAPTYGKT